MPRIGDQRGHPDAVPARREAEQPRRPAVQRQADGIAQFGTEVPDGLRQVYWKNAGLLAKLR